MNKYIVYFLIILIVFVLLYKYLRCNDRETFKDTKITDVKLSDNYYSNYLEIVDLKNDLKNNLKNNSKNYGNKPTDCAKGTLWDGVECNRVSGRMPLNMYFDNLNLKSMAIDNDNVCTVDGYDYVWCADDVNNPKWKLLPNVKLTKVELSNKAVCGLNENDELLCADNYKKPEFKKLNKKFKSISLDKNAICGTSGEQVLCADDYKKPKWSTIPKFFKDVAISNSGMCGIKTDNKITCADDYKYPEWTDVPGVLTKLDLNKNFRGKMIVGLDSSNKAVSIINNTLENETSVLPGKYKDIRINGTKGICTLNNNDQIFCSK
jgi:hypothetical protein